MGSAASVFSDFSDKSDGDCVDAAYLRAKFGAAFQERAFNRLASPDGRLHAEKVGLLMEQCLREAHAKQQWWTHLDATKVMVGEDAGDMAPDPQTPLEKMQFMFKWADLDGDGYLNMKETKRLMSLSGQDLDKDGWIEISQSLSFNPLIGMSFDCCKQVWDDIEDDYLAVKAQEKLEFMFQWCDKDGDGFLSYDEVAAMVKIQDATATFEKAEFNDECVRLGCDPEKGLTLAAVKILWKDDADAVYEIVKKDEKMRQMFRWADKDWNGYLDRKEAEALQLLTTPGFEMTPEMWNAFAEQSGFDPAKGFDYETASALWEDVDEDYAALFGQADREAAAAQAFISELEECWTALMRSETDGAAFDTRADVEAFGLTCDEETAGLAFKWLKRAVTTKASSKSFHKAKECVRALLASDAFWKGLGCRGNSWLRKANVFNDEEFAQFRELCIEKLKEIGNEYKHYFDEHKIGDKLGHLGADIVPGAPVRQPFRPCPNLPLKGPGAPFTNDGTGEDQYLVHLKLLSHALDHKFQQKVAAACDRANAQAARGGGGAAAAAVEDAPKAVEHRPAPVKTLTRMSAKLRGDHLMNEAPRSAANVDTIRCGVCCDTPADLENAYNAIKEEFGDRIVRIKNGYSNDYDPNVSFHYRGMLVNIEWHTGIKYGELAQTAPVLVAWDLVAAHVCNQEKMSIAKFAKLVDSVRLDVLRSLFCRHRRPICQRGCRA
eukprot:INCI16031.2.p1 GENE.INCI16031.2~~INCI16031.2.p1  ORF type:complete len:719 (+),score=164.51 INCI16031.2:95-2251(+)